MFERAKGRDLDAREVAKFLAQRSKDRRASGEREKAHVFAQASLALMAEQESEGALFR